MQPHSWIQRVRYDRNIPGMTAVSIKSEIFLLSPTTDILVSISIVTLLCTFISTQSLYKAESTYRATSQVFLST